MADQVLLVAAIQGALLLLFCTYMIYSYAARGRTPFYVLLVSVASWFLAFMVIFLTPVDIFMVFHFFINKLCLFLTGENLRGGKPTYPRALEDRLLDRLPSELVHIANSAELSGRR